jgi:Protein of unknown function (DUF3995)
VVGTLGAVRVPRLSAFVVAAAVLAAGVVALALADKTGGGAALTAVGVLLAVVFAGRGALGYTSWWQARTPEEPFRTLDQRNYSPLCLALGLGFAALVLMRIA